MGPLKRTDNSPEGIDSAISPAHYIIALLVEVIGGGRHVDRVDTRISNEPIGSVELGRPEHTQRHPRMSFPKLFIGEHSIGHLIYPLFGDGHVLVTVFT